jgi:hypothetical protein
MIITPIATGILIGTAFLLIFLTALHRPSPHAVPVGVVGPAGTSQSIPASAGLDVRTLTSTTQARQEIKDNTIYAAYVVQDGHYQMLGSSAHGATAYHTLEGIFTGLAASHGAQLQVTDVVPVAPADPNGVSIFYLIFGVTLGAFLFGQNSFATARRLPVKVKLMQMTIFSVVLGIIAVLIARVWIHAAPGPVFAEGGVLILLGAAIGAFTLAITTLLADIGVAIATIIGLILGTAISGGPVPVDFLPSGYGFLASAFPPGATVSALRDIAYYNSGAAVGPLLVLVAWIVVCVLIVFAVSSRRARMAQGQPAQADVAMPSAAR